MVNEMLTSGADTKDWLEATKDMNFNSSWDAASDEALTNFEALLDAEDVELDITVRMLPRERCTVKLNIIAIRKAKPRLFASDWQGGEVE